MVSNGIHSDTHTHTINDYPPNNNIFYISPYEKKYSIKTRTKKKENNDNNNRNDDSQTREKEHSFSNQFQDVADEETLYE